MSFPDKEARQKCWGSKDNYWECLDKNPQQLEACEKLRSLFEKSCPSQWVNIFDKIKKMLFIIKYMTEYKTIQSFFPEKPPPKQ